MLIFKSSYLSKVCFASLNILLFGQIIFQFLNYHFHIIKITTPFILLVYLITLIFISVKNNTIRLKYNDLFFFLFLFYLIISFIFLGKSDSYEFFMRIILVILGPYIIGRIFGSSVSDITFQIFLIIFSISFLILLFEILQNNSLLSQDRFILYDTKDEFGSGGSTQAFISMTFGSTAILTFASREFKKMQIFHILILFISILTLVLFGSRSSIFSVILTFVITYFFTNKLNTISLIKITSIFLIGILIFIFAVPSSRQDFFNESFQGEGSTAIRGLLFLDAISLFNNSPLFGIGASNFGLLYSFKVADFASPHSLFLHILTELGIFGFIIFLTNPFYIIYKFKSNLRFNLSSNNRYLLPLFSLWIFLIIDMQSYGNYFYDYQLYLISGIIISNIKSNCLIKTTSYG